MDTLLFQNVAGVIPDGTPVYEGGNVQADTPFVAVGLWVHPGSAGARPMLLCYVSGGKILSVESKLVRMTLTEPMKKALAEVILST